MTLQLHGNIKNYEFVRSAETKDEVEIQDSITHEVLYKKFRQTSTQTYRSQLVDPIPEVLLVEIEGKSSKDKLKKVMLYQPDDTLELKDTGILGFEYKFSWEGENYVWKRRSLGFSREIECKMVHGDDPGIGVAIFKPGKKTIGHMTIMYFNLERIGVNDKRGLEYVLLITMFSFLDKLEDESSSKKKNVTVDGLNEVVEEGSSETKKKEKWRKKKSSEKKEQKEKEKRLVEERRLAEENEVRRREMERREEERLRETEIKQKELLKKLKQEKEDQEYARKLLLEEEEEEEEERLSSHNYLRDKSNQRPRNNFAYEEHQLRTPSSSSTSTTYSPWETNYRNTYYGNPAAGAMFNPENSPPTTPPPKRTKKKPKEYKNEYGW
ncbi:2007_t:CDS:2 [Acaulospora colombiana]|uniref:2007_t:CDS:1 n=1 Tax=Acaulospora colombiana TaxID=27376 RepID=A0ACA9LU62_9GLOM|nr:2007_t:CDS:2 [Acaulospora colombiana]